MWKLNRLIVPRATCMPGIVHDLENKKQTRSAATECKYACIALAHA